MADRTVRPATIRDVPAIRSVARDAWHAAYDDIIGEEAVSEMLDVWYDHAELRASVSDDASIFLAAGDRAAGFAHATPADDGVWGRDDRTWNLVRLYVRSRHWGEGIGTALLAAVEDELRERGAEHYEVAVLADNDVGVSFYESRGFERTGTNDVELAGVGVAEYEYRKEL